MNTDEDAVAGVAKKIERERALINAANTMRQSTTNPSVQSRLDGQIREGRRNIEYLEGKIQELQMRRLGQDVGNISMASDSNGGPPPPVHGSTMPGTQSRASSNRDPRYGTDQSDYGDPGPGGYSQLSSGHGLMPPRAPYAPPGPSAGTPKTRPNYSRLGLRTDLIKYDTPHLGPRIQLMLSQLEFKLSVEKQYKDGIEKMVRLYQLEGDRKSRADAENRRIESNQKIQLLKQALKRYEDLHVDIESSSDGNDDDSLSMPSQRKPLTGHLALRIHAVADVDHASTGRFARGPETFVIMKVEDNFKGRTKATRNDKWTDEIHEFDIDKANEIELAVYDKAGDHPLPIGLLWIRISDIAEEMRRKRIETEFNQAGWVSADKMGDGSPSRPELQFQPPPGSSYAPGGPGGSAAGMGPQPGMAQGAAQTGPIYITAWFSLEPVGRIQLTMSFVKQTKERPGANLGIQRQGAIRQRKEEVHEQYGHKFIQQQFYNIMRCALCGDFLKYAAGMQCADCKYTCHKKCYQKVVTKCISKSNAETDPDEEKVNHRIPHRFEPFSNMGANWCCHCGYMLPFGRKQCRKCTECNLTCHAQCLHFVPDFCGMSMEVANQILSEIRIKKRQQTTSSTSPMSSRTFRPSQSKPMPPTPSHASGPSQDTLPSPTDQRYSYGKEQGYDQQPSRPGYTGPTGNAADAARASYSNASGSPTPSQQGRPPPAQRVQSSDSANAAAAAMGAKRPDSQGRASYTRSSTDYAPSPSRTSGGYAPSLDPRQEGLVSPPPPPQQQQQQQQQQSSYNPADYYKYQTQQYQPPAQQQQQPMAPQYGLPPSQTAQVRPQADISQTQATTVATNRPSAPPANTAGTGRRIGLDHFNFLAVLGKGNFGKVMLAETKSTKQLYAIKVLKKEFIIENDEVESTRSEKRVFLIANKERHPFLLNLHACFQTETRVYFVMEYISGGDLMLHIQRGQFGTKRAQFYAAEVCLALKYFHENGVIYRDLKLDNILLNMDGHIKIGDYGLCKEDMYYGSTTSTFCGTPEFMAPEILLDKKYGRAVDWWAFGVLIYQMLLQQSPFRGEDEDEIYDAILADEPLYPIHMPRDSVSILQKLLTREPELRLGSGPTDAQEIMSHAFFRNFNWDDVYHKRIPTPFMPQIKDATDTSNFDSEFTSVTPVLTPVQSVLSQAMQEEFRGFSYSADFF
ncbi:MAG: Serine/threonine kinase [Bogoriella megaspora]|nr:MAG: Serine/threonine kinase [Bogoriella megaspora]